MLLNKLSHCFQPARQPSESHTRTAAKQEVVDLSRARNEPLPNSKDVTLEHGVLYETQDIKDVLQRITNKSHPPVWLLLYKDTGDQIQNTPDRVLQLTNRSKQGIVAHFTDFRGDQEVVLGKYSPKRNPIDQLAQKIHDRVGYARFFLDASPSQRKQASELDDKHALLAKGSKMKVSITPPGLPDLKLVGPPPMPTVSLHEIQLTGAARWPNKALDNSNTASNKAYSQSMWESARTAGTHIKEGKISSYRQLWTSASEWRLSKTADHDLDKMRFVSPRNTRNDQYAPQITVTSLMTGGPYEYFYDKVKNKTSDELNQGLLTGQDAEQIKDEYVDLNYYMLKKNREPKESSHTQENSQDSIGVIQHTSAHLITDIMNHIESLFRQTMKDDTTPQEQLSHIAEAHWWVCNACPDYRGSAAKAEFCARAMGESCGIELPPFKDGILPDLEAMAMSKDDFVKQYPSLLERLPNRLQS